MLKQALFPLYTVVLLSFAQTALAEPITLAEQGSFAAGGTVIAAKTTYDPYHPNSDGQTLHADHAFVNYQIPVHARKYPLIFLHGAGQFSKTWDTTPDGREGFRTLFLRRNFSVYTVDQPRRGSAGRAAVDGSIKAAPDEGFWFGQFRMGLWPNFNAGSQFPQDADSLNQFFRQMTPNTAPYDADVNAKALTAVLSKTGPSVLITHSQGCGIGWLVGMQSSNVRAIVAYEPGSGFPFPEGEVPSPITNNSFFGPLTANAVPIAEFKKLTQFPIILYYGDFIPTTKSDNPHADYWRAAVEMANRWTKTINRHGGHAKVVKLPDVGIKGNSHFPFAEKNNLDVAHVLANWLHSEKLDIRDDESKNNK